MRCQETKLSDEDIEDIWVVPYADDVSLSDVLTFPAGTDKIKITIRAVDTKTLTSIKLKVENVRRVDITVKNGAEENAYEKNEKNGVSDGI